jgi:hypothetical protein
MGVHILLNDKIHIHVSHRRRWPDHHLLNRMEVLPGFVGRFTTTAALDAFQQQQAAFDYWQHQQTPYV